MLEGRGWSRSRALRRMTWLSGGLAAMVLASPAAAATITVTTTADNATSGDDICSLREAAFSADFNSPTPDCTQGDAGSLDTIQLGVGTYELNTGLNLMNTSDTGGL